MAYIMDESRHTARGIISEMNYGFRELELRYAKISFGTIENIIKIKGQEAFYNKSRCIRTRIAQYLMFPYVGNDTSHCTEFDDIITNYSGEQIDARLNLKAIVLKISILIVISMSIISFMQLICKEWKIYKDQTSLIKERLARQRYSDHEDDQRSLNELSFNFTLHTQQPIPQHPLNNPSPTISHTSNPTPSIQIPHPPTSQNPSSPTQAHYFNLSSS
ncbi:unnamed protein product [Moneuplotes crassus]|uniref:Uncharacterized protein n=1 Tax=Euplotes crassus TaxID=5936 RepID=A0AAD1XQ65_EUPCR|nr:unnamed protein product [Moneuplotes crassus]